MQRRWQWLLLLGVLVVTAVTRFTGLNWDDYHHYHPDERYISWVATTIEWPATLATAFDPHLSPFNPYFWPPEASSDGIVVPQNEPRDFAYGHLPLYLGVAATRLMERMGAMLAPLLPPDWLLTRDVLNGGELSEFRHVTAVSRALTALMDTLTVFVTFLLGRRLFGPAAGLLAAAFLSVSVLHIQLAHFFTVDPYLTLFVVTAVYCLVVAVQRQEHAGSFPRWPGLQLALMGAAAATGLAVGSKFSAVLLLLPLALTLWLIDRHRFAVRMLGLGLLAFLVFFFTNPFAVLDWTCTVTTPKTQLGPWTLPAVNWGSCYLDNIATQRSMVDGSADIAFTRQYVGTRPFLYYAEMLLRWGLGWPLGVAALLGLVWAIGQGFKIKDLRSRGMARGVALDSFIHSESIIILAWVLPYTLSTGTFFVKFMRYMQPVVPFLLIFAAGLMVGLPGKWRWLVAGGVGVSTAVYAFTFLQIYQQPHPWLLASQWVYQNVPRGAIILSEEWDDSLPSSMLVDGVSRRRGEYLDVPLRWHTRRNEADDEAKLNSNLELLEKGDYLTILSNRLYGVAPRLPEKYPLTSQYHQLLFDGSLGYEVVAVYGRFPHLAHFYIKPDLFSWPGLTPPIAVSRYLDEFPGINAGRADESFLVYDQPLTIIFQNTGQMTAAEMREKFNLSIAPSPSE